MNSLLDRFRIPTLLGLAIIILGTATGVYLVLQNQTITSQATIDNTPQKVTISNITDTSVTISWQTPSKIGSFVSFGTTSPNQTVVDDRDTSAPIPRTDHVATIRNLTPQTSYNYKVVAGKFNSAILTFQTAATSQSQNNFKPVTGTVLDDTQPLEEGLVFLTIPGAITQVAPIKSLGSFIIPLSFVRTEGLVDIISSNTGVANLTVASDDGRVATAIFNLNSEEPLILKIGQNLDLTQRPGQLGVTVNKFDLNEDGQVSTADYAIVNKNLGKKSFEIKTDLNEDKKVDKKDLNLILAEIKKNSK